MSKRMLHPRDRERICAALIIFLLAFCVVGFGAFASFTSPSAASESVATGTVSISLGATGQSTNRLNVSASGLAPGDVVERSFDLVNTGSLDLNAITLTTTASPSSLLDTDAA